MPIIDFETLRELLKTGQRALSGDSNDAEHDALYEIVTELEKLQIEDKAGFQHPDSKSS